MSVIAPRTTEQIRVDAKILERVKKGYALLQEKWGDEWVDHIDLRKLNLSDGTCCILGQLYSQSGEYAGGLGALWGDLHMRDREEEARGHGSSGAAGDTSTTSSTRSGGLSSSSTSAAKSS